jgi:predicted LPLAT superfamily acyltransferase
MVNPGESSMISLPKNSALLILTRSPVGLVFIGIPSNPFPQNPFLLVKSLKQPWFYASRQEERKKLGVGAERIFAP